MIETLEAMAPVRMGAGDPHRVAARLDLMLESLARRWSDPEPLRLTLVATPDEKAAIAAIAGGRAGLDLVVIDEREVIEHPGVLGLDPWFKQMCLKLGFAQLCRADAYLYLDDDVACVRPIGRETFVSGGQALSCWEPKSEHPGWWEGARGLLGRLDDSTAAWGLSVTPNVFTRRIAAAIPDAVACAAGETPLDVMAMAGGDTYGCWAEQTVYTEAGEMTGDLGRLHAPCAGRRFHSDADLWSTDEIAGWSPEAALAASTTPFVTVQSRIGVSPEAIRERLAAFL